LILRQHVEKCAHPHGAKDHVAAILVGFHAVIHAGAGEHVFQPQGVFQFL